MTIRLAFLVDSPSKGAHGNAASRLALGLAGTGRAETVLLCYSGDPPPRWLPPEVHIHRLGAERVTRSLPGLVRYLRAEQPDVLITRQMHANFVGLAAAWLARVPPRWRGKLVLVQDALVDASHRSNWRDNKWLAKVSYRFADGLIAPSPGVRKDTISWCGLDPSSTALVPNPIPTFTGALPSPPHPWLRDGEPPVFVNVSNMMPNKRIDVLIDAFASLCKSHDARLLIVGEGPMRSRAAEQIRRLGLGSRAETVGWIDDPRQFAARAWAMAHSSDEEGFGQVLTEAMSAGCPVVATDALGGGPSFVTGNGRYGLLVPRGDRGKLAEAMACMLQRDVRARYSELGRQRAAALSPAASAGALADFLSAHFGLGPVTRQQCEARSGQRRDAR